MTRLIGIAYSPWTEKARWALDHHRIAYTYEEHLPMLGELPLRVRARRRRVSVPVLFDDGEVFGDSFAIARHAEAKSGRFSLFPPPKLVEITAWNARSEAALRAGRARLIVKMLEAPAARREALPSWVPDALRGPLDPLARMGATFLGRKHGTSESSLATNESTLVQVLEELRAGLGGGDYLLGEFTYADISMAVVLQYVKPVDDAFIKLGPATREVWGHPALAARFADLLAWRDRTFERHRRA
jgi:glutathione S-transferase